MFLGIQFSVADGGTISLVHEKWLTPRKKEVWWPPHKQRENFNRSLKRGESPNEQWLLYKIEKTLFHEDNLQKAHIKLKKAEDTSDLATDLEDNIPIKRKRKPNRKLFSDGDESNSDSSLETTIESEIKKTGRLYKRRKTKELPPKVDLLQLNVGTSVNTEKGNSPEKDNPVSDVEEEVLPIDDCEILTKTPLCQPNVAKITPKEVSDVQRNGNIINVLLQIKQQNKKILGLLEDRQDVLPSMKLVPPTDIPVELPIKSVTDLTKIEQYLTINKNLSALASYCETLGGRDKVGKVNILRYVLSNRVAAQFSFLGSRNGKHSFSALNLRKVIVNAVLAKFEGDTADIDNYIKVWLKHAPKRLELEQNKKDKLGV